MLTFGYIHPVSGLGAAPPPLKASDAVTDLQRYLVSIGKLPASAITPDRTVNGQTAEAVYRLFKQDVQIVQPVIDLLPAAMRDTLNWFENTLNQLDRVLGKMLPGLDLGTLLANFDVIYGRARNYDFAANTGKNPTADKISNIAEKVLKTRNSVFNAIEGHAAKLQKGLSMIYTLGGGKTVAPLPPAPVTTPKCDPKSPTYRMCLTRLAVQDIRATPTTTRAATDTAARQPSVSVAPTAPYKDCFVRYNRAKKNYSVYCPASGLGEGVTPPVPAGFVKVATVTDPADAAGAHMNLWETVPFYERPMFWVATIGILGGGFFLLRRR